MAKLEGLPVRDALRGLELHVVKADVDRRERKNPAKCALASCASRMFKTEVRVYMSRAYVLSEDGTWWTRYMVSQPAQREITAFDRGARFEPGIYRLAPPAASQQLGAREQDNSPRSPHRGKKQAPRHLTINVRRRAPVEKDMPTLPGIGVES